MANPSPLKAIRAYCVNCKGKLKSLSCDNEDCKLYPFRDGHNPYTQRREMTPEQKAALAERMRNIRNTKG